MNENIYILHFNIKISKNTLNSNVECYNNLWKKDIIMYIKPNKQNQSNVSFFNTKT